MYVYTIIVRQTNKHNNSNNSRTAANLGSFGYSLQGRGVQWEGVQWMGVVLHNKLV